VISLDEVLLQAEVERFFAFEYELLDERRFDAWLDLLHEDLRYRMPMARNVPFDEPEREYAGADEASWFDEGKDTLAKRVQQLTGGDHWAEEPRSRTTHLVANVRVDAASGDEIRTKCRFVVYACRLEHDVDVFIGKRVDVLRRVDGALRLVERTILLDQSVLLTRNLTTFF
jgi:3-phenylpropionate/cinnamic acid dioxygenase small subunit